MKARYVLWPVMVFGAVSLASACGGGGSSSGPDTTVGGSDGEGGSGTNVGASSSTGNTDAGGMSTTDAGASTGGMGATSSGGASAGAGGAGGEAAGDLCEGKNLDCADDDNPCTEDECNPATGECGIPRSETVCDDGVWCNGADSCDAGECTVHEGSSCSGTCNEAGDYCECSIKADCPADEPGEWGTCDYASECAETVMRTRIVTKYSCNNVGKCVSAGAIESEACNRDTDTIACTDDAKPCNGVEACKAGNCVGSGVNPCAGQAATPFCYDTGTMCRKCTGSTAANSVGCGGGEKCCKGDCIPSGNTCSIIINPQIINPQIIINPQ